MLLLWQTSQDLNDGMPVQVCLSSLMGVRGCIWHHMQSMEWWWGLRNAFCIIIQPCTWCDYSIINLQVFVCFSILLHDSIVLLGTAGMAHLLPNCFPMSRASYFISGWCAESCSSSCTMMFERCWRYFAFSPTAFGRVQYTSRNDL